MSANSFCRNNPNSMSSRLKSIFAKNKTIVKLLFESSSLNKNVEKNSDLTTNNHIQNLEMLRNI